MAVDYQQQFQRDIVGSMMPSLNRQKKGMYDFLLQNALRTGQSATQVAEGLRPYAQASGQAAAEAGVKATGMARRATEFDEQMARRATEFSQGQENWQAQMDQRDQQQRFANSLAMLQQTGAYTPEMLERFGYGDASRGGQRGVDRQLDILGINRDGQGGGGQPRANQTLGAWNNWGGRTGLIYG